MRGKGRLFLLLCGILSILVSAVVSRAAVQIANSVTEFSGTQGKNNWYYGYYAGGFLLFPHYDGGWYIDRALYWTDLSADRCHPNGNITSGGRLPAEHWAVRRWISEVNGSVTISGNLADLDPCDIADGIVGYIFIGGTNIFTRIINEGGSINYNINAMVTVGSSVDFAVAPRSSDCTDTTRFTAVINCVPVVSFLDKEDLSRQVTGATADGATKAVIQITGLPDDITLNDVQISIPGGTEDGCLENDKKTSNGVFTQTYVVPACFVRNGHPEDLTDKEREISLSITVKGEQIDHEPFTLIRPPVVMVHGLWSNAGAFADLNTELGNNGFMFLYRPSYNNSAAFLTNDWVLPHLITNVLDSTRSGGYACTKVDIVAHSMGGLLAKRLETGFAQENVRKIITIGSPYQGSPLADLLWSALTDDPFRTFFLEECLNDFFHTTNSITGGAITDLRCNDNPNIPIPTQVPGVDCRDIVVGLRDGSLLDPVLNTYITLLMIMTRQWTPEAAHDFIFGPSVNSDWVVSEGSQKGDAGVYQVIPVRWHCSETQDADFKSIVVAALNQPAQISESTSSGLVVGEPHTVFSPKSTLIEKSAYSPSSEPNGTVEIIEPNEGQICIAGESITIALEGTGDTTHAAVLSFFGSASWSDIIQLPWQDDVNVPPDCVGSSAQIVVLGLDPNMDITDQDEVNLVLDSNVVLENIFFGFSDKLTFNFKTFPQQSHEFQLYPMGVFSDDSEHPLSVVSDEVVYESYDQTIASVDPNGLISLHSRGTTWITVTCSTRTAYLQIVVEAFIGDLNLNGMVDFSDFAILALHWLDIGCVDPTWCGKTDLDKSGDVNWPDLKIFTGHWLK